MNNHFDVFIIGGGMAGLNTARLLQTDASLNIGIADSGIRSVKNNPARLTFMDTISDNGLKDCILNAYKSFGIFTYHGAKSVHHFEEPVFVALDYNKACQELKSRIIRSKNISYFHEKVIDLEIADDLARLQLRSGLKITAKLVVDASGKTHFGLEKISAKKPGLYSHSFGRSYKQCRIDQTDVAYFIGASVDYGSGGGWYYPIDKTRASVGFALITDNPSFPARELKEKFKRAVEEVAPICDFLRSAVPTAYETGTIPIQPVEVPYSQRLLIVGDAAGQATSWMCMGVEPILNNSKLAADTIIGAFKKNKFDANFLADYKKAWDRKNKKTFDHIEKQKTKIWFLGEDVWDFILEKDLAKLTPAQLFQRIRTNAHLMPLPIALWRWLGFKIEHFREREKYKAHKIRLPEYSKNN